MKWDNSGKEGGELRTSPSFFCNGYSSRNRRWITYLYGQYLTSFLILFQSNSSFMFGTFFPEMTKVELVENSIMSHSIPSFLEESHISFQPPKGDEFISVDTLSFISQTSLLCL